MRLFALISTIVLLAGCSTNLDSDPSIPKAWVAINFDAQETFYGEIEHEPRGYLSKILIKERRNGELLYIRSGHTWLTNGMNFKQLEVGSIYALTHLKVGGAFSASYVFCGTSDLPAFKVLTSEIPQAAQNIKFSSRRGLNRIHSVNVKISPLSIKNIDTSNDNLARSNDPKNLSEAKLAFDNKQIKKVEQINIKPDGECGNWNYMRFGVSRLDSLISMSYPE
jgi:hypothetical protein